MCPEGDAEVVDAFTLSTWWSMFETLRSWAYAGRSDVCACWALRDKSDPKAAFSSAAGASVPALISLQQLASQNWKVVDDVKEHVPGGPKELVLTGICKRKSYLRCLLALGRLFDRGLGRLLPR